MADERPSGRTRASKPSPPKAPYSTVQPSPPSGSPLQNDGLESIRDSNT